MSSLKSRLKAVAPAWAKEALRSVRRHRREAALMKEFHADARRYARYASNAGDLNLTGRNREAQLTKDYHRIEKGLALQNPKRPFGADVQRRIEALIPSAKAEDPDAPYVVHAESALEALKKWNTEGLRSDEVSPARSEPAERLADLETFFSSRHSVRDFAPNPVDQALLDEAVALAINTPSVCNRQAWHVRFYRGTEAQRALSFQNGNRGFGHGVPVVALVTVDVRNFAKAGERNQAWIEGGLFSMSLVWALHGLNVDSCMLNLSLDNERTDRLRQGLTIHEYELPIMMIALGFGREGHRVARSPRRVIDSVRVDS